MRLFSPLVVDIEFSVPISILMRKVRVFAYVRKSNKRNGKTKLSFSSD